MRSENRFKSLKTKEQVVQDIKKDTNIPERIIDVVLESYWELIRNTLLTMNINEKFRIQKVGGFYKKIRKGGRKYDAVRQKHFVTPDSEHVIFKITETLYDEIKKKKK